MGTYINIGNAGFQSARNGEYVDKSALIASVNNTLFSEHQFSYAKNDYVMYRELPTGRGFADIVLIPRKNVESPAIVLELKYNKDTDAAIDQILRKQYPEKIAQYHDDLLLVAINYDKKEKTHQCQIIRIKE